VPTPDKRVAVITGGIRGIGRQIATRLGGPDTAVVLAYRQDKETAGAVVQELSDQGVSALAVQADIGDEDAVAALFETAELEFGGIDVVVNAAAVMPLSPLAELPLEDLDRVLRTNIRGAFLVNQQAAGRVRTGGAIVNFSSSFTRKSVPGTMAYTASKGAVEAMTLILARELRGRDITVNAVAPGAVETEMLGQFLAVAGEQARARIAADSPMDRIGIPDDVAELVALLAGPGRWINGQVIHVNGGAG
jgi:3-oxoacyl-[acyl-carrier protein] reductase